MKIGLKRTDEKVELQLTSMIDVIFLLLIFFIMTFKIGAQEGDFNVRMPMGGGPSADAEPQIPIKLRLTADSTGVLSEIIIDGTQSIKIDSGLASQDPDAAVKPAFDQLRNFILKLTGNVAPPDPKDGPEVEIDLDYNLRYVHVIQAITTVTGQRKGDDIVRLVEKIKFAPPRKP
jgi:biopolymer transport protein ExbD